MVLTIPKTYCIFVLSIPILEGGNMKTIQENRVEKGYTQKQMAQKMGIGLSTYQQKEQGLINWKISDLVKIKRILGINIDTLKEVNFLKES